MTKHPDASPPRCLGKYMSNVKGIEKPINPDPSINTNVNNILANSDKDISTNVNNTLETVSKATITNNK